jgi:hypothetical protein
MVKKMVVFLIVALALSAQAEDTWLFVQFRSVNYDSLRLMIVSDQLVQEVSVQAGITVKTAAKPDSTGRFLGDPAALKDLLQKNAASKGFSGTISRIDNTVFISTQKWDADGKIIFRDRISMQIGDDVDVQIKRLAVGLIKEKLFTETATTTTITGKEGQASKRKGGNFLVLGRAGILYPLGKSYRTALSAYSPETSLYQTIGYDQGTAFSLEGGLALDADFAILEATMSFDETRDYTFTIAGDYPVGQSDFCPYIGAEAGASIVNKADERHSLRDTLERNSNGISLGVRVGFMLFRNHSFKLMPELRFITVLNKDFDMGVRFTIGAMML